jgi:hypothetical protein
MCNIRRLSVGYMYMHLCIFPFEIMPIRTLGIFALNPKFLKFVDLFMQLMHVVRPKPSTII